MGNPSMHSEFTQTENVQPVRVNFIDLALAYTSKFTKNGNYSISHQCKVDC